MKEFTYYIPRKYVKFPGSKPIGVRAWETAVPGLIVQRPIMATRAGRVHLTHKGSGAIVAANLKGSITAQKLAGKLKRFGVNFTRPEPASLYRQLAKFTDRQVHDFRALLGLGKMDPAFWRAQIKVIAREFSTKGKGSAPAGSRGRSRKGDAWKGKSKRKTRQGRR